MEAIGWRPTGRQSLAGATPGSTGKMVAETKVPTSYKVVHSIEAVLSAGQVLPALLDGGAVMATRLENDIHLRSLETGVSAKKFTVCEDEDKFVSAFAASDTHLFAALSNNLVESRSIASGEVERSWKAHTSPILAMAAHSTLALLATGSADHSVRVWNSTQGFCTHNFKGAHGGVLTAVRFHPDAARAEVFSAADDGSVAQWSLADSRLVRTFKSHVSSVRSLDVSPDGLHLVTAGRDQIVNIWDLQKGKLLKTIPMLEGVEAAGFLSATVFYTAGEKGTVRTWDLHKGCLAESARLSSGSHGISHAASIGGSLVCTTTDLQLAVLCPDSLRIVRRLPGSLGEVTDVAFLEDGALAVATNDPLVKVFHSRESLSCEYLAGHSEAVLCVAATGDWLATGSRDHSVCVWRRGAAGFELVAALAGHTDAVSAVAIAGSKGAGLVVASAGADTTIKLWDVVAGEPGRSQVAPRWTIKAHDKDINSLAFTPNLKSLVSGSQDKTAKIWRVDDGSPLGTLKGHKRGVWSVRCSPAEQLIATASGDQTIRLWSATTFECLKTFEGHSNSVLRVAFVRGGAELVSTGADGLVKLWDIRTSECTRTLDEHQDRIWTLAQHGAGQLMATGDASGAIRLWTDCTAEEAAQAQAAQEGQVVLEQSLANLLLKRDYYNAIVVALELEQPFRLFSLVNEFVLGASCAEARAKLAALFAALPPAQLDRILVYIRDWNTSFKRAALAQIVLSVILQTGLTRAELPSLQECCVALQPYTERHFAHVQELMANGYLVDFVLSHMDNYMQE